jgi:hypothetical protein
LLPFRDRQVVKYERGDEIVLASNQGKGRAYFITDRDCASLRRLELASSRKRKVSIALSGEYNRPASMEITHHNFEMVIRLKKIEKE